MSITVEQLKENRRKSERAQQLFSLFISLACFALVSFALGNLSLWQLPVFFEALFVYWLLGTQSIKQMLGEAERPPRSIFNKWFTFIFVIILFVPMALFMLNTTNDLLTNIKMSDFKWESLLVLTPGPLLLGLANRLPLDKKGVSYQKLIIAASKKIFLSSVCLVGFFPIMMIVNNLGIAPSNTPDSSSILLWLAATSFFWLSGFLFFSGLLLVLFAIGDIFSLLEKEN